MVLDADALGWQATENDGLPHIRILTPHPGEMARLTGKTTAEMQNDRVGAARAFAMDRRVTLVLKGQRTVIAFPDGRVWINPTGTPALGTGGTGDVLTGMIAGFLAQFPSAAGPGCGRRRLPARAGGRDRRAGAGREVPHRHRYSAISSGRHGGVCRRIGRRLRKRPSPWENGWRASCRHTGWCC